MTSSTADRRRGDAADDRDYVIAVRRTDILDALTDHGGLAGEEERDKYRQVCRRLAAIYHYEYFARRCNNRCRPVLNLPRLACRESVPVYVFS